jgi:predicted ATPase
MIKLEKLKIKGFKNIREAELDIGNFNVIVGPNNSGKSNLLRVISFLNFILNESNDEVKEQFDQGFWNTDFGSVMPAYIKNPTKDKKGEIEFDLDFSDTVSNKQFKYQLALGWNFSSNTYMTKYYFKNEVLKYRVIGKTGPSSKVFSRTTKNIKSNSVVDFGGNFKLFNEVPNHASIVGLLKIFSHSDDVVSDAVKSLNKIIKTPIFYFSNLALYKHDNPIRKYKGRTVSCDLESEIIDLYDTPNWGLFRDVVQSVLSMHDIEVFSYTGSYDEDDEDVEEIEEKHLVFYQFNGYKNLKELSDGTVLILALIVKTLSSDNDLILIEEPENSTHPKALVDLYEFLKSFSTEKQFIITSHSIPIINKSRVNDIIVGSIDRNGTSEFTNISEKTELVKRLKKGYVSFSEEIFFSEDTGVYEEL